MTPSGLGLTEALPCPGQDPNPAGLAAGTVVSIILALVLLAVLLVVCGPLAYKKLVKKCRCWYPEPPALRRTFFPLLLKVTECQANRTLQLARSWGPGGP